jgi:hypothetical protein
MGWRNICRNTLYILGCKRHGFPEKDILYRSIEHPSFCWSIPAPQGFKWQCHKPTIPQSSPWILVGGINLPFPGKWMFYDVLWHCFTHINRCWPIPKSLASPSSTTILPLAAPFVWRLRWCDAARSEDQGVGGRLSHKKATEEKTCGISLE